MTADCRTCPKNDTIFCRPLCLKRDELIEHMRRLRGDLSVEDSAEPLEEAILAGAREAVATGIWGSQKLLAQVEGAIKRAQRGTWGRCLECGEEISDARLAVLPWTSMCLACAAMIEAEETCFEKVGSL